MKTRFRQAANSSLRRVVKEFREVDTATVKMTAKYFRTEAAVRLEEGRGERERQKWQRKLQELRAAALQGGQFATTARSRLQQYEQHRNEVRGMAIGMALAALRKRKAKKREKADRKKLNYGRAKKASKEQEAQQPVAAPRDIAPWVNLFVHGSQAIYSVDGQHPSLND